ncbi:facilitated trehalose transporter Tret1-2 homolog [Macrosteles quadrilineatus]|uniref:facilitated trehalose transporter Tret1-2 homolog n=1 Tax=Macrosteles quadrilineatus TaxID=74068 RepID=UPI0023E1BC36|nr:facilitated trehalose transporter Tret1-2 homolog [Macrosteles quadrilineatus]XP_054290174.1 facilitated trehalose transporter Tret1-2 homolog [Macrosteles quadrilineatus]
MAASRLPQYIAALVANLGALNLGTNLGWTSTAEYHIKREQQYGFPVSDSQFSWVSSLMPLGALIAAPAVGWLVTTIGRKSSMIFLCVPSVIGYGLLAWAQNVPMLYIGRLLTGMSGGGFGIVVPLYVGEIAETNIRGTLGVCFQLLLDIGILFTYIIGSLVSVKLLSIFCLLIPVICGVSVVFIPESPIYYLEKSKDREAEEALQWFRGSGYNIQHDFTVMQQNIQEVKDSKVTFFEAFSSTAAKKGLVICLGLMLFQQFCGVNSIVFYTDIIFKEAGSSLDSNVQTIVTGLVNLCFTYVSSIAVDRLGRRPLLLVSDIGMAICTFLIGLFFFMKDKSYDMDSVTWVPITAVCLYLISFALGYGPLPWVFLAEVFPRKIAGYAASVVCMFNYFCVFIITNFFDDISSLVGRGGAFFIFTAFSIVGTLFVIFIVPETKNKTLEEILKELED